MEELDKGIKMGRNLTDEDGFYHRHTTFGGRYRDIRAEVEEKLDLTEYETVKILDVGSSKGSAIDTMIANLEEDLADGVEEYTTQFETYCIDISNDHTVKAYDQENIDHAANARAGQLPLQEEAFDVIICNGLLPYLEEDPSELETTENNPHYDIIHEINRVIKQEGIAVIEEVNKLPFEQQYILNKNELEQILQENNPKDPLTFDTGETIEMNI